MIYPANFEQKVGFDRLREQVAALCTIRGGRERLCAEQFSTSQADVERRLALADEMRRLLEMEHDFPDDEFVDVDYILSKLKIEGSFLEVEEVVLLRRALASAGAIAGFILGRGEELYPELRLRSRGIEAFPEIVRAIDGIVDQYGKIRDDASPELQQIRRMILEREGQAAKRLQQVLSNAKKAGIVEADAMLSIRDGRAVIPVAAANKRKLQGFIHDESATGKTFYVEPVEVVEINNELKELEYAERREIVRILSAFTDSIRPEADRIALIGDYLSDLDMIRAKARWAVANGAVKPIVSTEASDVYKRQNYGHHPIYVPVRIPGSGIGEFGAAPVPQPDDRHRGRAVDRRRSFDLFVAPAQYEEHARRSFEPDAGAYRRVRLGYGAHHRRGDRGVDPRSAPQQRLLRGDYDPLCQH